MIRLVAFAFRRCLPRAFLVTSVLLLVLAARGSPLPEALANDEEARSLARGLARLDVWSVFWVLAVPGVLWQAARLGARWRSSDADWLAPSPVPRLALGLACFTGAWGAGLALALLAALAAEAAAGDSAGALRWQRTLENPSAVLLEESPELRWEEPSLDLGALPAGTRFRLRVTVAPGSGPAVTATFSVGTSPPWNAGASVERRIFGRTALALPVPAGLRGPAAFELSRTGEGALLVLPARSLELLVPAASEHLPSFELFLRAALFLAAAQSLTLGLASWMRPTLAAASVASLALLPWAWGLAGSLAPAGDLPRAWRLVGEGIAPAPVALAPIGATLALVGLGCWLQHRSLLRGRGGA